MKQFGLCAAAVLLLLALSGCGAESGGDAQAASLQEENRLLQDQLTEARNDLSTAEKQAAWVATEGTWRCDVETPENRLWLSTDETEYYLSYGAEPYADGAAANTVAFTGTVLEAYTSVTLFDYDGTKSETWLMVRYPIYSIPAIPVFWVRQSQCVPYTVDNQEDARSPVSLRSGTIVTFYGGDSCEADADALASFTIIDRSDGNIAQISQAGGWEASVRCDDIIYPDPATFTYSGHQ